MDEIQAEEITITLIRDRKPVKLLQKLSSDGYECRKETAGIYYVSGVMFPGADHCIIGTGYGFACTAQGTD